MVTLQDLTFYAIFKTNQNYITKQFCVNKEKKELKCKGSCHYKKQLEKKAKSESKNSEMLPRFETAMHQNNYTNVLFCNRFYISIIPLEKHFHITHFIKKPFIPPRIA